MTAATAAVVVGAGWGLDGGSETTPKGTGDGLGDTDNLGETDGFGDCLGDSLRTGDRVGMRNLPAGMGERGGAGVADAGIHELKEDGRLLVPTAGSSWSGTLSDAAFSSSCCRIASMLKRDAGACDHRISVRT